MISPRNILKHELIGLIVRIKDSSNKANIGIRGKLVDETKHTILIDMEGKDKRVFKNAVVIEFNLPSGEQVEVKGSLLEGRPWDRVKRN